MYNIFPRARLSRQIMKNEKDQTKTYKKENYNMINDKCWKMYVYSLECKKIVRAKSSKTVQQLDQTENIRLVLARAA